jgi:CIC family chloride channel protein
VIGMAGVVGGATGAAMTAIMMLFEMTGDYGIALAGIISVACAIGTRRALMYENIYTMKLARRGHYIPKEFHSHMYLIRHARDVMSPVGHVIERADLVPVAAAAFPTDKPRDYAVVVENHHIHGVVAVDSENPTHALSPILSPVGFSRDDTFLQQVMAHMARRGQAATLVIHDGRVPRAENIIGVVTRDDIAGTVLSDFSH